MSKPDVELQCLFRRIFFVTKVAQQSFCLVDGFHVLGHFPLVRESDVTLGATRPASYQVRLQNVFLQELIRHKPFVARMFPTGWVVAGDYLLWISFNPLRELGVFHFGQCCVVDYFQMMFQTTVSPEYSAAQFATIDFTQITVFQSVVNSLNVQP